MSVIVKDLIKNYYQVDSSTQFDLDFAIRTLAKKGILCPEELVVIKMIMEGAERQKIVDATGLSTPTIDRKLNEASEKVSKYLGEAYSDEKIINMAEYKLGRPLTETEIAFCWFMIRFYGRKVDKNLNIHNFRIARNGRFVPRDEGQAEG